MNPKIWKWLNRIFSSGIWLQPFTMAFLVWFFQKVIGGKIPYSMLLLLSILPTVYVWSENQRQSAAGKQEFGIEDTFHSGPTEYSSPLKQQAMYPRIEERLLFERPQGVVLGKAETGTLKKQTRYLCKPMEKGNYRDGHVLIVGGSGSGKSSAVIIPTLLSCPDTGMFCIDIKGELWRKSRRMDDEDVVIIDFQDRGMDGWDALYILNRKETVRDQDLRECMEEIAGSLIPISAKDSAEFWKQSARSLLTGELIGLYKQKDIRNLSELINEILSRDTKELVAELMDGARPKAVEVKYLSSFKNLADETLSGVVQQEEEALKAFTDEDIRFALESNKRKAQPLMLEEGKAVFLAVREEKLEAYYNVINLIIAQVFGCLIKRPEGSSPVMVVIDEAARLCARGPIPYLHNGILLTGRSRNITLILVTQSYEALQNAYTKADIESMVANCAYLVCLDVRSQETAKSICSMAGTYQERETTWSGSGKNRSVSISYRQKPILEPSDLSRLVQMDEAVLIAAQFSYCRVKKCSYYNDPVLAPLSAAVQRYNREAMGLEGQDAPLQEMPEMRPRDTGEILVSVAGYLVDLLKEQWKECCREIKEKTVSLMQQYEKGEKEYEKRRDRTDTKRNGKKTGRRM